MGLLDLFKKKEPVITPAPIPAPPTPPPPVPTPTPPPPPIEKKPTLLKDFFKVDIVNLLSSEDDTIIVSEDDKELGCFRTIRTWTLSDGSHNLEMTSFTKRFSPEMYEFVAACTSTFGKTKLGEGNITSKDVTFLIKGLFSRLWKPLWLDMGRDEDTGLTALRLTIFNVEKNAFIEMA
jgi:hypothetical protein